MSNTTSVRVEIIMNMWDLCGEGYSELYIGIVGEIT